jgi:hypothetical protein
MISDILACIPAGFLCPVNSFGKSSPLGITQQFLQFPRAYSGNTRSPFPVISVHFLFIFLLAGVKLILFS